MSERTKEELIQQIERKNQLLKSALEHLVALEWDVNMGLIVEIEENLKFDTFDKRSILLPYGDPESM